MTINQDFNKVFKDQTISSYSNVKKIKYWIVSVDKRRYKNWYANFNLLNAYLRSSYSNPIVFLRNYPNLFTGYSLNNFPIVFNKIFIKENTQSFKTYSFPNKVLALFGKYLSSPSYIVDIDIENGKFTMCNGSIDYITELVYSLPIYLDNFTYSEFFFFYVENVLFTFEFFPYYETIQYPFLNSIYYNILIDRFERHKQPNDKIQDFVLYFNYQSVNDCITNSLITYPPKIEINRPKLVFSKDLQTWYKYDFSTNQFVEIEDYNYDKHLEEGNTFLEYWRIPSSAWLDFLDNDKTKYCYYSINNTFTPILINPVYFEDYSQGDLILIDERNNTIDIIFGST